MYNLQRKNKKQQTINNKRQTTSPKANPISQSVQLLQSPRFIRMNTHTRQKTIRMLVNQLPNVVIWGIKFGSLWDDFSFEIVMFVKTKVFDLNIKKCKGERKEEKERKKGKKGGNYQKTNPRMALRWGRGNPLIKRANRATKSGSAVSILDTPPAVM